MTNPERNYLKIILTNRLFEYKKIAEYKNEKEEVIRKKHKTLLSFYLDELDVSEEEFLKIEDKFKYFKTFFLKRNNKKRELLFSDALECFNWLKEQNDQCNYCHITQEELYEIAANRTDGNLTLNQGFKRSSGTLEIENKDPNQGYSTENSILACPFCNNAKSNLISHEDWSEKFAPVMKEYLKSQLKR